MIACLATPKVDPAAAEATGCGALVSLGGDIATAGPPPPNGWTIAIADSHAANALKSHPTVTIRDGAVATSSTTVRRWVHDDRTVHHIIDPATSLPAVEIWRTATVAAATCVDANIASTTAIIRGRDAVAFLREVALPARLVRSDGTVVAVNGWPEDACTS